MKTEIIEGCLATNFGANNYSCGMEAVTFDAMTTSLDKVKTMGEIYLHPFLKPNQLEIFALKGTGEQFADFYRNAVECEATRRAAQSYDFTDGEEYPKFKEMRDKFIAEFKPWYDEN